MYNDVVGYVGIGIRTCFVADAEAVAVADIPMLRSDVSVVEVRYWCEGQ